MEGSTRFRVEENLSAANFLLGRGRLGAYFCTTYDTQCLVLVVVNPAARDFKISKVRVRTEDVEKKTLNRGGKGPNGSLSFSICG